MSPDGLWRLERNDRRVVFACDESAAVFADTGTAAVGRHEHPAWKLLLPLGDGPAEVARTGRLTPPAVLIPPQWPHSSRISGGYIGVFVDIPLLPRGVGPIALSALDKRRLRAALAIHDDLDGVPDLEAVRRELLLRTGRGDHLDPRVALALEQLMAAPTLADLARTVGLSAPRLRRLVHEQVGVPLARLRRWRRLRTAIGVLPAGSVADAAAHAEFADQAHLARTARDMVGRAPSSLLI
ncbi:helix-turn-helix domain-containing protein [Nocardia cyriacigeorgica]|uniref:helix-turn-helix domain-containing protein n=1 Tax=Nocardia cyriacigeorgica TaxID=135487 RepID=UPI001893D77D|nr:helix-turn-helix domain-containing protein [Nocardia cyriacigeorgica]MBF6437542.1 helix-turn-helix domain-containing protein [Nocardia cyriacigeorgica]